MDAKKSALRKIDALLSLGRPDPFEGVPDDEITPDRMARLKARCAEIRPFQPQVSDDEMKVTVLCKVQGYTFVGRRIGGAEAKRIEKIMVELEGAGFVRPGSEKHVSRGRLEGFTLTEAGQQYLDARMKDPRFAALIKEAVPPKQG